MDAEIRLTRVKKHGGALLCKRICLGEDGRPVSDGSPCAMARGTAKRVRLNGSPAANLVSEILDLGSHEALVLGDLADGLPDKIKLEKDEFADAERGHLRADPADLRPSAGSRRQRCSTMTRRRMPGDVRQRLAEAAAGSKAPSPASLLPGYAELARVLPRLDLGRHLQSRHRRALPRQRRAARLRLRRRTAPTSRGFLETLQKRAWLAGFGWIMVGARGQLLVRSIVDTSGRLCPSGWCSKARRWSSHRWRRTTARAQPDRARGRPARHAGRMPAADGRRRSGASTSWSPPPSKRPSQRLRRRSRAPPSRSRRTAASTSPQRGRSFSRA